MNKKVILGAFFHWDSFLHIGSHQYAKEFARAGYKVAYISKPISALHYVFAKDRNLLKERRRVWSKGGEWVENERIWTYVPFTLLPFHKKFTLPSWAIDNRYRFTLPSICKMLKRNDFKQVDLLFLDELLGGLLHLVAHKKSVLRIHDDIRYLKRFPVLYERQKKLMEKFNLVVTCSKLMESFVREMGARKILYLPNAVDFEHFYLGDDTLPEEYKNIPSPRVIYVGAISKWFNIETLYFSAKKLPQVSFVLIGQPRTDLSKLKSLKNIYILGGRGYKTLPAYLKNADVGIIPWDSMNSFVKASHPNKLYMYMACGLPVVATNWNEIENIGSPAYLVSERDEFAEMIKIALRDKDIEKHIAFAKANSWKKRLEKLIKKLYSEGE